ncbi:MAG: methyltransferase domain-containing protein [Kofleriaceae bacterium]
MLHAHLTALGLTCATCRAAQRVAPRLTVATLSRVDGDDVREGVLVCPACRCEHPIIDGVAVVVPDLGAWVEHQGDAVMRRHDLSPVLDSLLGDAFGRGGSFDRERHDLSTYATAHWGDRATTGTVEPFGSLAELVATALALVPAPVPGDAWLDVGCSTGRGTFELAAAGAGLAVGVDLNFAMLARAEAARRTGRIAWPRRRVGLVFDPAEATLGELPRDRVAFVCADVGALPFADGAFGGALSLNVLDCVPSPLAHLLELGRVLAAGAPALLSTPYDWSASATAAAQWIGGHSQRGPQQGASEPELRRILSADAAAGIDTGLVVVDERDDVPWRLTLNARSTMHYRLHLLRLARRAPAP